jgi:sirohydrochlorin ferrochelatase
MRALVELLLVAHGSQCLEADVETQAIVDLVAASLPDVAVAAGYLGSATPTSPSEHRRSHAH